MRASLSTPEDRAVPAMGSSGKRVCTSAIVQPNKMFTKFSQMPGKCPPTSSVNAALTPAAAIPHPS